MNHKRSHFIRRIQIAVCACLLTGSSSLLLDAQPPSNGRSNAVSLSLYFENGSMPPITFYGNPPRYLNEADLIYTTSPQTLDDGIEPLMRSAQYSKLDWRGVQMVEEDWRRSGAGGFQRQRFFRNANWMNARQRLVIYAVDSSGKRLGPAIRAEAGSDDHATAEDDFFVRRLLARQIATGCKNEGDCRGAKFVSELLVQLRYSRHAESQTTILPAETAALQLEWSQLPGLSYQVAVRHAAGRLPYGYGFQVSLDVVSKPANQRYFVPGENVKLRALFRDGQGRPLNRPGRLPTYGQFMRDENESGLRYYDPTRVNSTVYYALKHREGNILLALSGPTDKLRQAKTLLDGKHLVDRETVVATVANDGYSAVFTGIPSFAISTGGPARWNDPVPDTVSLTIPADALPGTYIAAIKARRIFGGEALNRAATTTLQVGTLVPTAFKPTTGNCENCHQGAAGFDRILHGVTDRSACFACHIALSFEEDNALDYRVHAVHSRSRRFPANVQNCSTCHNSTPSSPARGLLAGAGFARGR